MPLVNLSTLNDQDLRQRLDWSRARGDAAVAYGILQEMAARREVTGRKRTWLKGPAPEPRMVEIDMSDPMEADSDDVPPMPNWRPPTIEAATTPPPQALPEPPRKVEPARTTRPPPVVAVETTKPQPARPPEPRREPQRKAQPARTTLSAAVAAVDTAKEQPARPREPRREPTRKAQPARTTLSAAVAAVGTAQPQPARAPEPPRASHRKAKPERTTLAAAVAALEPATVGPARSPEPAPEPLSLRLVDEPPTAAANTNDLDVDLEFRPEPLQGRRASGPHRLRIAAGFAIGIISGLGLGWLGAGMIRDAPPAAAPPIRMASLVRSPDPAPPTLDVRVVDPADLVEAAPEPPPPPELPPEDVPEPEPEPAAVGPAPEIVQAEAAPAAAPRPVELAKASDTHATPTGACAAQPTPADREICSDPELQRLQRELRQAYSKALDAHEDRALLRQRQLAWREARNTVTDPDRLARLYEQRIGKLYAAAAEARAQR